MSGLGLGNTKFTNYQADVNLPAFKFMRGGQPIYTICPTLEMVLDLLPIPDPLKKFPNNRLLNRAHAVSWGKYWEKNENSWGCPAGIVSTPMSLTDRFTSEASLNGMHIGVLSLPRDFAQQAEILDMQHRIYGWHDKRGDLKERLLKANNNLLLAKQTGPPELVSQYESQIVGLKKTIGRLSSECMTIEIAEMSESQHRDLFSNIASKALSINQAQIADFDDSQAVNRIARAVQTHELILGRVDWDRVRVTDTKNKPSPNLISGANLVELVRPFASGQPIGKIPEGRNEQIAKRANQIESHVRQFLTALTEAFPEFEIDGEGAMTVAPSDIRASSLLGSPTVLRALAAAYYWLTRSVTEMGKQVDPALTHAEAVDYFAELAPHMDAPLKADSKWLDTGVFADPAAGVVKAPGARTQDIKSLADQLTDWGRGLRDNGPLSAF